MGDAEDRDFASDLEVQLTPSSMLTAGSPIYHNGILHRIVSVSKDGRTAHAVPVAGHPPANDVPQYSVEPIPAHAFAPVAMDASPLFPRNGLKADALPAPVDSERDQILTLIIEIPFHGKSSHIPGLANSAARSIELSIGKNARTHIAHIITPGMNTPSAVRSGDFLTKGTLIIPDHPH